MKSLFLPVISHWQFHSWVTGKICICSANLKEVGHSYFYFIYFIYFFCCWTQFYFQVSVSVLKSLDIIHCCQILRNTVTFHADFYELISILANDLHVFDLSNFKKHWVYLILLWLWWWNSFAGQKQTELFFTQHWSGVGFPEHNTDSLVFMVHELCYLCAVVTILYSNW